jgi:hypothetical protein
MAEAAQHVGEGTEAGFELGVGVAQHGGVYADPAHDDEAVVADRADVEPAALAVQGHVERAVQVGRDPEVVGEQVAGPAGEHGQRHLRAGQAGDAGHHGAVAAGDHHQVGPLLHGPPGDALSRVVPGGLAPAHLQAVRGEGGFERGPAGGWVLAGGGVEHHGHPARGGAAAAPLALELARGHRRHRPPRGSAWARCRSWWCRTPRRIPLVARYSQATPRITPPRTSVR